MKKFLLIVLKENIEEQNKHLSLVPQNILNFQPFLSVFLLGQIKIRILFQNSFTVAPVLHVKRIVLKNVIYL